MDINEQLKQQIGFIDAVPEAGQELEKRETIVVNDFNMVTFSLAGKDYGIDIMNVKEIAKADRFTYVPNTLPFVRGVYNLRGEIIPILDLRLFFNNEVPPLGKDKQENLLILNVAEQMFGVVVDKIDKVVGIQKRTIQPPHPLFGDINIKYISGVAEANKRLYVLLDIDRIFNSKASVDGQARKRMQQAQVAKSAMSSVQSQSVAKTVKPQAAAPTQTNAAAKPAQVNNSAEIEKNLKFVKESLANYKKFYVTPINEQWIRRRFDEWSAARSGNAQLQNESDATEFLKPFFSRCTGNWWNAQFADEIMKLLPDNTAKQISVWNPGCGRGVETYSLACVLARRYPDAKIKIYAQDTDLLAVSNAPLMAVPEEVAKDWFAPYITTKANGEYTFTQDIKNSIMFEYHDCTHTNALPVADIIFARDVLSYIDANTQNTVVSDFNEKLKGNGLLFLGENEILGADSGFVERSVGQLTAYNK